jgi:type II secretory pathway pseudopilin PulG
MNRKRRDHCARGPARSGVTLTELVVVLAMLGLVGSTIGLSLVRQQRFYRGATDLLRSREGVRDAMELLSTDIRGMSVADTVRLLADSAIEFFANVGSSVVCDVQGGTAVGLPGLSQRRANALTSFLTQPDTGDIAVFHRDSIEGGSEWEAHRISRLAARPIGSTCPTSSRFGSQAEVAAEGAGFLLELATQLSSHVGAGAPVRFIRRGRYSLYRASDGSSYLGYRRCNALGSSACGAIQPLSGPYRGYSSNPRTTGLLFEYFDRAGAPLESDASPLGLARVDITARAEGGQQIGVDGRSGINSDSATITIAIRNRVP